LSLSESKLKYDFDSSNVKWGRIKGGQRYEDGNWVCKG